MELSQRAFRDALGSFATGITVVTTMNAQGKPVGMTANSFASLSLDPPLVLWNVGDQSDCFEAFRDAGHFAIHILHSGQQAVSKQFSTKGADKFAGIDWHDGQAGSPVLEDFSACFECTKEASYPGGDHLILVGRVVHFEDRAQTSPIVFYRGQYKSLA